MFLLNIPNNDDRNKAHVMLIPGHLMLPEASIHGVALGNSTPEEYNEMGCAIVAGIEAGWVISEMSFRLFYEFTTSQFFF